MDRRQADGWASMLATHFKPTTYVEQMTPDVVWEGVQTRAASPKAGMQHFASAGRDAKRQWGEFSNYIRQARVYFDAGQKVSGTSSSLLYYYCALQLAKAELLASVPNSIVGQKIHHGLSHDISNAGDPRNDFVKVMPNGVFPLMYKSRTGFSIPPNSRLRVATLLRYLPDVATEIESAIGQKPSFTPIYHSIFRGGGKFWNGIAIHAQSFVKNRNELATKVLLRNFEPAPLPVSEWKKIFGVSNRTAADIPKYFQSRATFSEQDWNSGMVASLAPLNGYLENPIYGHVDGYLNRAYPQLGIPMNGSIARYVLMFYLSSLVRYKPVILDPNKYSDFVWVFESFCRISPLPLIVNSTDAILGRWHTFGNSGRA